MNRSESKFHNSAKKMQGALITLLENNEFSDLNIMDICRKAGVNRSTFYAHYDNTYELLTEAYASLIDNFKKECDFGSDLNASDLRNLSAEEVNFIKPQYLLPYLRYIKKHKRLFKIYVANVNVFGTDETDEKISKLLFVPVLAKHGVTDKRLIAYVQKFYLKGIEAIITEWVKHDCEDDEVFVSEIITFCVRPTT